MRRRDELYQIALRQVAENRQRAITRSQQENQRVLAAIPQLTQLEQQKQIAGANAVMAGLEGDSRMRQAYLDQVAALEMQRKKLLTDAGYPENALEPHYHCPICKDTGRTGGVTCDCVHLAARALRREEINAASPLSLCDFATFDLTKYPDGLNPELGGDLRQYMGRLLEYCQKYAQEFTPASKNLLFMGSAGLGKTRLALSIADRVLSRGYDVIYSSAADLVAHLDKEHFNDDSSPWMDTVKEADLLILDDLGTEYLNSYTVSALYELINTRLLGQRATIYTTNITDAAVFETRYTEKIASRILGNCKTFRFFGTDLRITK